MSLIIFNYFTLITIDQHGNILASSNKSINIAQRDHGMVEQYDVEILDPVLVVINNVLANSSNRVIAAALSTQRSTLVAWDSRTRKPLATVIY